MLSSLSFGGKNWEKQQPMIKKRAWAATATFGEEIITGGYDGDRVLETTEIRREDGSWHYFDVDLPEPTSNHCMVTISSTKILFLGGWNGDDYTSTVYLLDKTNIGEGWQQKP